MKENKKGYIQVYTGNGKGKTTAAIGQAIRAAGFGLKIYFAQFMKEYPYSELESLKLLKEWITIEQYGKDDFVYRKELPNDEEVSRAKQGLDIAYKKMISNKFDLIILDEILVTVYFKLFKEEDIFPFIDDKPENVELILTGRYCPQSIIDKADLVTEMKEVKHYYTQGVLSRKGIES